MFEQAPVKKILSLIAVLVVLLGTGWFVLPRVLIDATKLAVELKEALHQATGRGVTVGEGAEISLWPAPQVTLHDIKIANSKGASSQDFLKAQTVILRLTFSSLFSGTPVLNEVVLGGAGLELEIMPGNRPNWVFSNQSAGAFKNYFLHTPITLQDGLIRFTNASNGAQVEIEGLNGSLKYAEEGSQFGYEGKAKLHGQDADIIARLRPLTLTKEEIEEVPFQLLIKQKDLVLKAEGALKNTQGDISYLGNIAVDAPHIWSILNIWESSTASEKLVATSPAVKAQGKLSLTSLGFDLKEFAVSTVQDANVLPVLKGTLDADYRFGDEAHFVLAPHFETVDYDQLLTTYRAWMAAQTAPKGQDGDSETASAAPRTLSYAALLKNLSGEMDGKVDSVIMRGRSVNNVTISATLEDEEITINQLSAVFPGNAPVALFGVLKPGDDATNFDGKFEAQGESLEQMLSFGLPADAPLPEMDMGAFILRTNLAYSKDQFRISEMQMRIKDTLGAGAFIFHLGDRMRVESFLRIAHVDLDAAASMLQHFMPSMDNEQASEKKDDNLFNIEFNNTQFSWLNTIGVDIQADIVAEDFILFGRKGERARARLNIGVGQAQLSNVEARYNNADFKGMLALRIEAGKNPFIDVQGEVSDADLADVFPSIVREMNDDEWKEFLGKQLDFLTLQTYRARADLKFGKLAARRYSFENLVLKGTLEDNKLSLNEFSGYLWDGGFSGRAEVVAGTIPAMSANFTLENANLVKLSQATPLLKHAAGRGTVKAELATSGVSLHSWLDNATGVIGIYGQDVAVQGFGLDTLVRAVPVARSVAELVNAKRAALDGGVSLFRQISGNVNIQDGRIHIPNIQFTSEQARGTIEGDVDLINSGVDLLMRIQLLATLENNDGPAMLLSLKGSIDTIAKELQTQDLEAYVARKAAEHALTR